MRKMFIPLLTIIVVLLSSCVTESYLVSSEASGNKITFENGNDFQTANTEYLTISAAGMQVLNSENSVLFGIENKTDKEYGFKDSQISVYGGNIDTGKWSLIKEWDAAEYMSEKVDQAKSAKTAANVLGTLAVIDAIFNPNSTVSVYDEFGHFTTYYDGSNVFFTILMADLMSDEVRKELNRDLKQIKSTLLFSNTIKEDSSYNGLVYFPTDRIYPDYKLVFKDSFETEEFLFQRTDRDEILHPWSCDRNRDLFALTYSHSVLTNRFGFDTMWLAPKGVGTYIGFYEDLEQKIESCPFGLTIKCSPHTWLLAGFELGSGKDDKLFAAPQVGINASYNWTDVLFKVSYDIPSQTFLVDAGFGFAL